jgi:protein TonB
MFSSIAIAREAPARGWSALTSFTFEAALVAAALVYPLLFPESLPPREYPRFLPLSTMARIRAVENTHAGGAGSRVMAPILVSSHPLSSGSLARADEPAVTAPGFDSVGRDNSREVLGPILGGPIRPMPGPAATHPPRVSAVMEGNLIYRVEPQYPSIAKQLHVEGTVVVKAFISREGTIEQARVERGQPWLAAAALEAVRQWRYRPYYLNHEPIEVETEIIVNFLLER